jgi:molybdopterin-guanine dinucleotide biosynthesis protein A
MGGSDKGLLTWRGRPLITFALEALGGVAATLIINANRNLERYREFGYPVIPDRTDDFDGPLAGLLSAMHAAKTPYVLIIPCDVPMLSAGLLSRLVGRLCSANASIAVAHDGERLQPLIMLASTRLAEDLETYLAGGGRKVETWVRRHVWVSTDFSDRPEVLANINTPEDLAGLKEAGD